MSIGPTLYSPLVPPGVWVTLHELDHPESDTRRVTMRVKPVGRRSVSAFVLVSKYSPEVSILLACSHAMRALESSQSVITQPFLKQQLQRAMTEWVEPF